MRLPGTCSRYSKSAMPQLMSAATYQGRSARFFRCAYQANVMNTFEQMRSSVAETAADWNALMPAPPPSRAPSARHTERAQRRERARVVLVHDAVPAALAGGGDVLGAIIDENRRRRTEREAPLGLGVDPGRRLHDPGEVRRQRAVADAVQPELARQVRPVQVADVGKQVHPVALAQAVRQRHHGGIELEHSHPLCVQLRRIRRLPGERGEALEQLPAVLAAAFVLAERYAG